jgi:lipoprotein-releasing system permease protein
MGRFLFSLRLAWRYLVSRKSRNVVHMITGLSLGAIFVVSAALVVILSAFNGLEDKIVSSLNVLDPPLLALPASGKTAQVSQEQWNQILDLPQVEGGAQILEESVLLMYGSEQMVAVVRGVDANYLNLFEFSNHMVEGDAALNDRGRPGVLMGEALADRLGLRMDDPFTRVQLYAPKSGKVDLFQPFRELVLPPAGVFFIPQEANRNLCLIPLEAAAQLFGKPGEVSALHLVTRPGISAQKLKPAVAEILGEGWLLQDRLEQHEAIHKILRAEKLMVLLIVGFILLIASFNLISVQTLLLVEKQKDLRILWSMGAEWADLRKVFTLLGTLVSALGGFFGVVFGLAVVGLQWLTGWYRLNEAEPYPVVVKGLDVLVVLAMVMSLGALVSWWRMRKVDLS